MQKTIRLGQEKQKLLLQSKATLKGIVERAKENIDLSSSMNMPKMKLLEASKSADKKESLTRQQSNVSIKS